jgi:hypothetical protein
MAARWVVVSMELVTLNLIKMKKYGLAMIPEVMSVDFDP